MNHTSGLHLVIGPHREVSGLLAAELAAAATVDRRPMLVSNRVTAYMMAGAVPELAWWSDPANVIDRNVVVDALVEVLGRAARGERSLLAVDTPTAVQLLHEPAEIDLLVKYAEQGPHGPTTLTIALPSMAPVPERVLDVAYLTRLHTAAA